jgi:hypothetical protein
VWLKEDSNIYLRGFDIVKKSRDERVDGRVAILINNNIKYTKMLVCMTEMVKSTHAATH